jgi:hypothetical protein
MASSTAARETTTERSNTTQDVAAGYQDQIEEDPAELVRDYI